MKRLLFLVGKIILGFYAFYLFLCCIVIPLLAPPLIGSQASKIVSHQVKVRAVLFNPFLWRLNVYGFRVLDAEKRIMAGFDHLSVDVSFIRLFAKEYRVEAIDLDGLQVNAVLASDGKINLAELAAPAAPDKPAVSAAPVKGQTVSSTVVAGKPAAVPAPAPLPLVTLKRLTMTNAQVRFTDKSVIPDFTLQLSGMECSLTGFSTRPGSPAHMSFRTRLDDKGTIGIEARIDPFSQPIRLETDFTLSDYALRVVTPYCGKYTGRAVKEGKLDIKMVYRIEENKLTASHKLLVQSFDFGEKVESRDALPLPFGLAVALLEDPQGRISISLPVTGDMSSPEFHYWHLVGQVVRNFFMKLVTKPFMFLASVMGAENGTEEMGYVGFTAGSSMLTDAEKAKLDLIIRGLKERPKLFLEVNGSYDPDTDWKAIKTLTLDKEYKDLRANSEWPDSKLYQMMYVPRFGWRTYRKLIAGYRSPDGTYDYAKINPEVRKQLEEHGSPDLKALEALAGERARAVFEYISGSGFDPQRLRLGTKRTSVQGSMGAVPQELTLTVFGEQGK